MSFAVDNPFLAILARRINEKLRSLDDNHLRFLWIDDFIPGSVVWRSDGETVDAMAYLSEDDGRSFERYRVSMHFAERAVQARGDQVGIADFDVDRSGKRISLTCR